MLGQHLLREGLGLKKSNTERAIKIAAIKLAIIVPQYKLNCARTNSITCYYSA